MEISTCGNAYYGIEWYFTGAYTPQSWSQWDKPEIGTGGYYKSFFADNRLSNFLTRENISVSALENAADKLHSGYAVGISVVYYDNAGNRYGHQITLWGFTCDTSYSVTNPNYYTGIIVTDSDDDKYYNSNPNSAPDTLKVISIYYDSTKGKYYLDPAYVGTNAYLEELVYLAPKTAANTGSSVKLYSSGTLVSSSNEMTGKTLRGFNSMFVSSGGSAVSTVISSGGVATLYRGGKANYTSIYSSGSMCVSSGGSAANTTVNYWGDMYVFGTATDITNRSGGYVYMGSGAYVNGLTASSGAALGIAVTSNTCISGTSNGSSFRMSNAYLSGFTTNSRGRVNIESGGMTYNVTARDVAGLHVYSYGIASNTTLGSAGWLYVENLGTASNTTISSGGWGYIYSGGQHKGRLTIYNGGGVSAYTGSVIDFTVSGRTTGSDYLINNLALIYGAPTYTITVSSSQSTGTYKLAQGASNFNKSITVTNGSLTYGTLTVNGAGFTYGGKIYKLAQSGGNLTLSITSSGGSSVKLYSSGTLVSSADVMTGKTLRGFNSMFVSSGGSAVSTVISSGGGATLYRGGKANYTSIYSSGSMWVSSGGSAANTTVNYWGDMYVYGTATNITNRSGGYVFMGSGANVTGLTASAGAVLGITVASNTCISGTSNGSSFRMSNAYLSGFTTNSGGRVNIESGGSTYNVTARDVAALHVYSHGIAGSTTLGNNGWLYVNNLGTASNTTVSSGGWGYISSGGQHKGRLTIYYGGGVSAYTGSLIDFTVSGRTASSDYLINNLALINGAPTYTITVSSSQSTGTYKLAQGASNFNKSITVTNGSLTYGTLTVNGTGFIYGGKIYKLAQSGGNLTLSITSSGGNSVKLYSSGTLVSSADVMTGKSVQSQGCNSMYVSSGGTANSTTVSADGILYVSSGGRANFTSVGDWGYLDVKNSGIVQSTTLNYYGYLNISSGGMANYTTVNSVGNLRVSQGGYASNTTLKTGGILGAFAWDHDKFITTISNGICNISNNVAIANMAMSVYSGGTANNTSVYWGGGVTVASGGVANKTSLFWGNLYVSNGGIASNTTFELNGWGYISSGGQHKGTLSLYNGGGVSAYTGSVIDFTVSGRTTSSDYLINNLALIYGAPTYTITVSSSQSTGTYKLAQGASNFNKSITVKSGSSTYGTLTVNGTGFIYGGKIYKLAQSGGNLTLSITSSGGNSVKLYSSGTLVSSADVMTGKSVQSWGYNSMFVSSGGTANSTTVSSDGILYVSSGGRANFTSLGSWGYLEVKNRGIVQSTTVNSYGFLHISSGGMANYTTVNFDGNLRVFQGGYASNTTLKTGGILGAFAWDHDKFITTISNGICNISNNVTIADRVMSVSSGGTANNTSVYWDGGVTVASGGVANKTSVFWGDLYVSNGGAASNTFINTNGWAHIYSGGQHKGRLTIYNGGGVSAYTGSVIDFTVSDRTASSDYLINNLALIYGAPTYTITVSSNQSTGTYKLAQGASNFNKSITVKSGSSTYGTLTVNGTGFTYGGKTYKLAQSGGNLTLSITSGNSNNAVKLYHNGLLISSAKTMTGVEFLGTPTSGLTSMYVSSGGTANSTTVIWNGNLFVYNGGKANNTTVNWGTFAIHSGGVANNTTVNWNGRFYVYSGGTANSTTLNHSSGYLCVYNGGTANYNTVNSNGNLYISSGGVASVTTVNRGGAATVYNGGLAKNTTVNSDGALHVYNGGTVSRTTVNRSGYLGIGYGATAYDTTIGYAGALTVWGGGVVSRNTLNTWGTIILSSGALARSTTVNSLGGLHVYSGAVASNTTIKEGGILGAGLGATVYETKLDSFGSATLWGGAVASNTSIGFAGEMTVLSGGLADTNKIGTWGAVILSSGAVGNSTTILTNGGYHIYDGAVAFTTMITSGAFLGIGSGGTVYNLDVQTGAGAQFFDEAILRGWNDFAGTVTVNEDVDAAGAMIALDITNRSSWGSNIISNVEGISGATYYLTVDRAKYSGRYYLAGNAESIHSITITGSSKKLIVDGGMVVHNGNGFSLGLDMYDNLYVDIVSISDTNSTFDAMDLGTWDEMEIACDASLAPSDERKDVGILAIA